jgi:hypothetical protein
MAMIGNSNQSQIQWQQRQKQSQQAGAAANQQTPQQLQSANVGSTDPNTGISAVSSAGGGVTATNGTDTADLSQEAISAIEEGMQNHDGGQSIQSALTDLQQQSQQGGASSANSQTQDAITQLTNAEQAIQGASGGGGGGGVKTDVTQALTDLGVDPSQIQGASTGGGSGASASVSNPGQNAQVGGVGQTQSSQLQQV